MFFVFFFVLYFFQRQNSIELNLYPFTLQEFHILIPPNKNFEIHYAVNQSNLTHNYVGLLITDNKHAQITSSELTDELLGFQTKYLKIPNNFCIAKNLSGMFNIKSISNSSVFTTFKIVSLGSTGKQNLIPIFDSSDVFDFESIRNFLPDQNIQLAYFNLAGGLNSVVDVNYSVTEYIQNSIALYLDGRKIVQNNLNQHFIFCNSHIGFLLNSLNTSSIKSIKLQKKIEVQNRYWKFNQGYNRLVLQNTTIPIVVAIVAAYYLFGIIYLILICYNVKSRLNRIYGSLFGKCMCCCTDFEGYYEVADFYQSHPRYYYSDYNSCGCRKCQCCYENHCSCCNCYYSCNEKLCQCCYERHNYRYFNFLRILFSISSLVTFPIVSFISVLHLCNPTLRDKDFEENYKDQDIKYKTPMTISKFYSKFKLKGKTYSNSKSEIDNFDSSDESNEIQDVEKPFANQQAPVEEENSYSGSENSAIELPPIQEKTEIKTSQPETKQEQPKVKINPDIVPSITEKNEENHDVNKVEETALKPLQLSGSRQLSYACSPLAANETENSVFVQSIQEPPLEEPSNVAKIGLDILPLPAQHALPPPNFENNYQSDETHEKHDESHGERSRNSKMKRQHRMSMPNFSNIPEFTPLNNEAVDHFKDILDHRNVLTDDDANDIFFPKKRGHQKRKYSHDVWRKSMELFEPPSNFDTETIEIPENIPSNETISNYSSRNNSEEEIPNFVGTLPLFQADGMSIIIPPTAAEYNGIAPPITFIDPQGNVKPTEKRRQKKRRASAWVETPTISKTNDLSFLF